MNFDEFVNKYFGKAIDYDGVAGVQCVDLVKQYLHDVFDLRPGAWGNAHEYFDNFEKRPELKEHFTRIKNTPDFMPQKGDICVWKSTLNKSGYGHIAIATGTSNLKYFTTYDQNWNGRHDPVTEVKHSYSHFAGVLRPQDLSKIFDGIKQGQPAFPAGEYKLLVNIKVRTGAGTDSRQKNRSELTADGQKHAANQELAVLRQGTVVTVKETKRLGDDVWGRIPSGWIALKYDGSTYVKRR